MLCNGGHEFRTALEPKKLCGGGGGGLITPPCWVLDFLFRL